MVGDPVRRYGVRVASGPRRTAVRCTPNASFLCLKWDSLSFQTRHFHEGSIERVPPLRYLQTVRPIWPAPSSPDTPAGKSLSLRGNDY
jgi:hypothetical protein